MKKERKAFLPEWRVQAVLEQYKWIEVIFSQEQDEGKRVKNPCD